MADSAYIQEWPLDKLTVGQLRVITPVLLEWTEGVDEPDPEFEAAARKLKAALDRAEEGIEPPRKAESRVYFFGCMQGAYGVTQPGHYFYAEGPNHERRPRTSEWLGKGVLPRLPSAIHIDGGFCPHYAVQKQYAKAKLTHWAGWTVVGFWDSSGDTRPGSDSNFFMKGTLDFEDAMTEARRAFAPILKRCEDKYGPIECVMRARIP